MSVAASEGHAHGGAARPQLEVDGPREQTRLIVALRLVVLIPHFVWRVLLQLGACVVAFCAWFVALLLGRVPGGMARLLTGYVRYAARLQGSVLLLVEDYPPFGLGQWDDSVRIRVEPARLNRFAVFFRWLLVFPAAAVGMFLTLGWGVCSFVIWLVVLAQARMPEALFEASAAVLRYRMRLLAYVLLLSPAYPRGLFGDGSPAPPSPQPPSPAAVGSGPSQPGGADPVPLFPAGSPGTVWERDPRAAVESPSDSSRTRPLLVSTAGKRLVVLFLVLGILCLPVLGYGVPTVIFARQSVVATDQVTDAYRETTRSITSVWQRIETCQVRPGPCYRQSAAQLVTEWRQFAGTVAAIDFPPWAEDAAAALQTAVQRLARTLQELATASSGPEFVQTLTGQTLADRQQTVRATYHTLIKALTGAG